MEVQRTRSIHNRTRGARGSSRRSHRRSHSRSRSRSRSRKDVSRSPSRDPRSRSPSRDPRSRSPSWDPRSRSQSPSVLKRSAHRTPALNKQQEIIDDLWKNDHTRKMLLAKIDTNAAHDISGSLADLYVERADECNRKWFKSMNEGRKVPVGTLKDMMHETCMLDVDRKKLGLFDFQSKLELQRQSEYIPVAYHCGQNELETDSIICVDLLKMAGMNVLTDIEIQGLVIAITIPQAIFMLLLVYGFTYKQAIAKIMMAVSENGQGYTKEGISEEEFELSIKNSPRHTGLANVFNKLAWNSRRILWKGAIKETPLGTKKKDALQMDFLKICDAVRMNNINHQKTKKFSYPVEMDREHFKCTMDGTYEIKDWDVEKLNTTCAANLPNDYSVNETDVLEGQTLAGTRRRNSKFVRKGGKVHWMGSLRKHSRKNSNSSNQPTKKTKSQNGNQPSASIIAKKSPPDKQSRNSKSAIFDFEDNAFKLMTDKLSLLTFASRNKQAEVNQRSAVYGFLSVGEVIMKVRINEDERIDVYFIAPLTNKFHTMARDAIRSLASEDALNLNYIEYEHLTAEHLQPQQMVDAIDLVATKMNSEDVELADIAEVINLQQWVLGVLKLGLQVSKESIRNFAISGIISDFDIEGEYMRRVEAHNGNDGVIVTCDRHVLKKESELVSRIACVLDVDNTTSARNIITRGTFVMVSIQKNRVIGLMTSEKDGASMALSFPNLDPRMTGKQHDNTNVDMVELLTRIVTESKTAEINEIKTLRLEIDGQHMYEQIKDRIGEQYVKYESNKSIAINISACRASVAKSGDIPLDKTQTDSKRKCFVGDVSLRKDSEINNKADPNEITDNGDGITNENMSEAKLLLTKEVQNAQESVKCISCKKALSPEQGTFECPICSKRIHDGKDCKRKVFGIIYCCKCAEQVMKCSECGIKLLRKDKKECWICRHTFHAKCLNKGPDGGFYCKKCNRNDLNVRTSNQETHSKGGIRNSS